MSKITICFVYFKSLGLANLEAALYSVRQQDLSLVDSILILDNDTPDDPTDIQKITDKLDFPIPVRIFSIKHKESRQTHSWSTNAIVRMVNTPWFLFTRADYILDFSLVKEFVEVVDQRGENWNGFIVGNVYHLNSDISQCELTDWRILGANELQNLSGVENDYTHIDSGVWMTRRDAFDRVNGLDESLDAWGHAQTDFQHRLFQAGTEFVRIPRIMFCHPQHTASRDIGIAHQQLMSKGADLKQMWSRYHGVSPY